MRKKCFYLIKVIIPGNVKMVCDCCILTLFETIFFNRKEIFENKDDKWCINGYDILKCRENVKSNEAKWCILTLFESHA